MFREIGLELSVRESAVIGIFDLDNVSWSKQSRAFLSPRQPARSWRRPTRCPKRLF